MSFIIVFGSFPMHLTDQINIFLVPQPDENYSQIGKTGYNEAKRFCLNQGKVLCSYSDYCPNGELSEPLRGRGNGRDVWAPISDLENDWVQLSDYRVCKRHLSLGSLPTWATTGCCNNNEVLCCKIDADT